MTSPPQPPADAQNEAEDPAPSTRVLDIVGDRSTCFRMQDASVLCTGSNFSSELIAGGSPSYDSPTPWKRFPAVVDVHVGHGFGCALLATGAVHCWGSRLWGRLGDGCALRSSAAGTQCKGESAGPGKGTRAEAKAVERLGAAVEIAGGWNATCARTRTGGIWCWGSNIDGALGNDSLELAATPQRVHVPDATELHAGANHFCTVSAGDRRIWCWGTHFIDDAANPMERDVRTPKAMEEIGPVPADGRLRLTLWGACVVDGDGRARCWGSMSAPDEAPTVSDEPRLTLSGVRDVSAGNDHICIVTPAGAVRCGTGSAALAGAGQAADAELEYGWHEVSMPFDEPVKSLHAKPHSTCALSSKGRVACWGLNDVGQLGIEMDGEPDDPHVWRATHPSWP